MPDPRDISILELASTAELLSELHRRADLFIYVLRPLVKEPGTKLDFLYGCSHHGGMVEEEAVTRGIGYIERAKRQLLIDEDSSNANSE